MIQLYDQTTYSDRAAGTFGDCTRACLRTLAQDPMPDLPHPIGPDAKWNLDFFEVLEEQYGWLHKTNPYRPNKDWSFLPRVIAAAGPTVRTHHEDGQPLHLVIWDRVAGRMIHDPHPSRAGLISITGFDWLERINRVALAADERSTP